MNLDTWPRVSLGTLPVPTTCSQTLTIRSHSLRLKKNSQGVYCFLCLSGRSAEAGSRQTVGMMSALAEAWLPLISWEKIWKKSQDCSSQEAVQGYCQGHVPLDRPPQTSLRRFAPGCFRVCPGQRTHSSRLRCGIRLQPRCFVERLFWEPRVTFHASPCELDNWILAWKRSPFIYLLHIYFNKLFDVT